MRLATPAIAIALSVLCATAASAEAVKLDIRQLDTKAWVLMGSDGNVAIVPGESGALIVDCERAKDFAEIAAAVDQVTHQPVKLVIDTHWHLDHSGANGPLAQAGATVIAQRNVYARLSTDQFMAAYNKHVPASAPIARPGILFDDRMEVHQGGEVIELRYAPNAHTDGDALVFLKHANVLHMGDVFFNGIFPFIDRSSNGSIQGMIAGVDMALAMADDKTRIVPGHGEIATKAELQAYRNMLQDLEGNVAAQMKAGKTLDQIVASKPAASYRDVMQGDEDRLIASIYDSLKAG